jgi:hypothetical protein
MEQIILSEHGLLLLQARYVLKIKIKGLTQPQSPTRHLSSKDLDPLLHAFFYRKIHLVINKTPKQS